MSDPSKQYTYKKGKYGLNDGAYVALFQSQGGRCAICQKRIYLEKDEGSPEAHVDHCHVTGRIRGLLCKKCNTGLGLFDENTEVLKKAITYLDFIDSNMV